MLGDVLARLVEELKRNRDVLGIDVMHLADIADVRRAVFGAGRDGGRDDAFENRGQRSLSASAAVPMPHTCSPAPGPGVWAKTPVTRISIATAGCMMRASVCSAGTPTAMSSPRNAWRHHCCRS